MGNDAALYRETQDATRMQSSGRRPMERER
jgi:hypothetical protein